MHFEAKFEMFEAKSCKFEAAYTEPDRPHLKMQNKKNSPKINIHSTVAIVVVVVVVVVVARNSGPPQWRAEPRVDGMGGGRKCFRLAGPCRTLPRSLTTTGPFEETPWGPQDPSSCEEDPLGSQDPSSYEEDPLGPQGSPKGHKGGRRGPLEDPGPSRRPHFTSAIIPKDG